MTTVMYMIHWLTFGVECEEIERPKTADGKRNSVLITHGLGTIYGPENTQTLISYAWVQNFWLYLRVVRKTI